jgi:hypothetical protein
MNQVHFCFAALPTGSETTPDRECSETGGGSRGDLGRPASASTSGFAALFLGVASLQKTFFFAVAPAR